MKNYIFHLFAFSMLFYSSITFPKIWILDTNPGNLAKDFTSLQTAHDSPSVLSGDTLYLSGFNIGYGNLSCSKQLHIFGPGYFLTENNSTQANPYSAFVGLVYFNNGSEGSSITGCYVNGWIYVYASNITIERNYLPAGDGIGTSNVSNIIIRKNYITSWNYACISITSSNNVYIRNNYIYHSSGGWDPKSVTSTSDCTNIILDNNIFYNTVSVYNASITNNILRDGDYNGSPTNTVQYNICNGTQFPNNGTNQLNVNMSAVFLGTGSTDGQWQLAPGSPAIGTGVGGTDIGMYGGVDPYVLSGIPPIPTIYQFIGSNAGTQSLPVQLKIKSRN